MNEDPIQDLLRSLPREKASEGFTERVMSRLNEARRPLLLQPRFAVAVSVLLILVVWVGAGRWYTAREDQQTNDRIQTLRSEIQQLQQDIGLLRDLAPVLYLGEDKKVDFVLDIRKLTEDEEGARMAPASFPESKGETPR